MNSVVGEAQSLSRERKPGCLGAEIPPATKHTPKSVGFIHCIILSSGFALLHLEAEGKMLFPISCSFLFLSFPVKVPGTN